MVAIILAAIFAAGGGTNLVLLFSGLGGLSGLAAIATVYVTHKANSKKAAVEDKSVAIVELEKAVPGMGDIIKVWQDVVHQLQADNLTLRDENVTLKGELSECRKEARTIRDG